MEVIPDPETKICSKCGEAKPLSEYYVKVKSTGRLFSWCKVCHVNMTSARIKANPEKHAENSRNYYRNNPEMVLAKQKAARDANPEATKAKYKAYDEARKDKRAEYRKANAEKRQAYNAAYREANAEKIKASDAAYRGTNAAEIAERQRAWREANPERYLEIHRNYKQANPDVMRAIAQKRYALIKGTGGTYKAADWVALKEAFNYECLMCGRAEPEIKLTIDHIIPISKGGPNTIDNLQPLCKSCNSKKHRKTLDLRKKEH